jgi:hypothetical protein
VRIGKRREYLGSYVTAAEAYDRAALDMPPIVGPIEIEPIEPIEPIESIDEDSIAEGSIALTDDTSDPSDKPKPCSNPWTWRAADPRHPIQVLIFGDYD